MNILNLLSMSGKTVMNKMCTKNKAEVFFYRNVIADLSSGGTDFSFWYFEM